MDLVKPVPNGLKHSSSARFTVLSWAYTGLIVKKNQLNRSGDFILFSYHKTSRDVIKYTCKFKIRKDKDKSALVIFYETV